MPKHQRNMQMHPIVVRELEVLRVEDITSGMRRIIFGGPQLRAHDFGPHRIDRLHSTGFDDDVRLIFPDPATGERPRPQLNEHGTVIWDATVKALFRTYTVRWFDEAAQELAIDFARHGVGLAEHWSHAAQAGDKLWVVGPKACRALPTHRDWLLLVGDETALPAIARGLEELPAGYPVHAVIEVARREHIFELRTDADATITWLVRAEGEHFQTALETADFPPQPGYAWVAGEAGKLRAARKTLRARGFAKEDSEFTGYWRDNPVTVEEDGSITGGGFSVMEQAHELTEFAPAFLIRAAIKLGVFTALDDGIIDAPKLAEHLQLDAERLARLLRFLAGESLVTLQDGRVRLTPLGREFADEESFMVRLLVHEVDRRGLSLAHAERVMRTGVPAAEYAATDQAFEEFQSITAPWSAEPMAAALGQLPNDARILIRGYAAAVYAEEVRAKHCGSAATLDIQVEAPHEAPRTESASLGILIDPGATCAPAALGSRLAEFAKRVGGGPVYVVTTLAEPGNINDHLFEEDMVRMCSSGGHIPTLAGITEAARRAQLRITSNQPIGLGDALLRLDPAAGG